jgi:VIT1/CCC1 family predicted Fe2+/Mn2+ transporter
VVGSVAVTLAVLFAIGVAKSRWSHRRWFAAGFEVLVVGAIAGIAGYFFGILLPILVGVPQAAV